MSGEKTTPTLFVGLGGTGSKIVGRIADKISESERRSVAFAVLDTDINDLRRIEKKYPFIRTVQTSQGRTVGEFLEYDKRANDEWFPTNVILGSKPLTEGAGQVRAISRLAFEMTLREGRLRPLHEAVESLYRLEENHHDQALRVTVISSLCGGTGSGIILPVGLYLRNYLERTFRVKDLITRGFFLLPEVYYDVICGADEQESLRSNAYATLRELDTFMMKGEGFLPERYRDVKALHFEMPADGIEGRYDEYNCLPYNFCFLFDGKNTKRLSLNNHEQYLEHAANCVYAQSVGATGARSNSIEDNKIRDLMNGQGRNRYAGAGCASIIYPVEDVKEYVSLKWSQNSLSGHWMQYDKAFRRKQKDTAELRSRGALVGDDNRCMEYIQSVDNLAKSGDPFSNDILRQCYNHDERGSQTTGRWEDFIDNLKDHVGEICNDPTLNAQRDQARKAIESISSASDVYAKLQDVYTKQMENYRSAVFSYCKDRARSTALTVFDRTGNNVTGSGAKHCIETYMRDNDHRFVSPNAARYFLYKLLLCLKDEREDISNKCEKAERELNELREGDTANGGEGNMFDIAATEKIETVNNLRERAKSVSMIQKIKFKLKGELTADQRELINDYETYMECIENYRNSYILKEVLLAGEDYVSKMIEAYEAFFDSFDARFKAIDRQLVEITKKYNTSRGSTIHYVCASSDCLDKMVDELGMSNTGLSVDSNMSESVYNKVREFAFKSESDDGIRGDANAIALEINRAFEAIFNEGIVGYYKKDIMKKHGAAIDMDVLRAIDREYELFPSSNGNGDSPIERAVNTARQLADPFIESVMGAANEPVSLCACNPAIIPKDDSERSTMIRSVLSGYTASDRISKYRIDFYKGIYCLRANALSKFTPDVPGKTAGEYFKAYYTRIGRLSPRSVDSREATPHIDRRWHIVTNMPDLDEEYQEIQIKRIYRAFVLGFVYDLFDFKPIGKNRHIYRMELPGVDPEELVVSNGTPCDLLYEVLDALTWTPVFVTRILDVAKNKADREILATSRLKFTSSYLYNRFNQKEGEQRAVDPIHITEYEKVDGAERILFDVNNVTIFDLVALLKISTPAAEFNYKSGIQVLSAAIEEVESSIERLSPKDEIDDTFGEFIRSQFEIFESHADRYDESFEAYFESLLKLVFTRLEEKNQGHVTVDLKSKAKAHGWY